MHVQLLPHRQPGTPRPARRTSVALAAALLALTAVPAAMPAQSLRVQVIEAGSDQPLPGVIVEVHRGDAATPAPGTLVVAGVTAAGGVRLLPLGSAGTFRVRARRIGFEPFVSEVVTVAAGQTVDVPVRMPARRVALPAVVVAAERRCDGRAVAADAQVAVVWEEVRKALTVSELSRRDRAASTASMRARAFERHLDAGDGERRLFVHPPQPIVSRPFEARPTAELSESGYVRRTGGMVEFLAPDERVLLSEEFVGDHCFALARGQGAAAGLIGLEFTPAPDRRVPEVAGVLWIDSASAELRHLDFWFVDRELPSAASGAGRSGGQVVFARLPDGAWSPVAWRLRMPVLEPREPPATGLAVDGWVELGAVAELPGEVGADRPASLAEVLAPYLALARPARVAGVVLDSLLGAPLAGARVHLTAARDPEWREDNASALTRVSDVTPHEAVTDTAGRFVLDSAPAGFHRVHVSHPALDSAGILVPALHLRLAPGASETIALSVPPRERFETSCTASGGASLGRRGILFGTVRRAADGAPLRGARVTVRWSSRQAGDGGAPRALALPTRTGDDGVYRVCDLPLDEPLVVSVEATVGDAGSGPVTVSLGDPRDVMRRDLVVPTAGGEAVVPVAGQLDAMRAVAIGRLVDERGAPVVDATVSLYAVDVGGDAEGGSTAAPVARARTDSIGNFRLLRLPLGEHEIVVQRLGYRMLRQRVALGAGDTTRVLFTVPRVPTTLGAVEVVAPRGPQSAALLEVARRRQQGFGQHVTEEEIGTRPTLTALLQGMRGVRLVTNVQGAGMPGLYPGDGGFGRWVVAVSRTSRRGGTLHRECVLALFVDGVRWSYTDLALLRPADLAAIEVYTQVTQLPARFRTNDGACGAVLVWTVQAP